MIRTSRVGQWSEDIEYCTDTELLADRSYILHGSMILLSKEEAETNAFKKLSALLRLKADICTESFKTFEVLRDVLAAKLKLLETPLAGKIEKAFKEMLLPGGVRKSLQKV